MKTRLTILAIAIVALMAVSMFAMPVKATATVGPRIDELLAKIYTSETAEFSAFGASEIDLVDWPLGPAEIEAYSGDPNIVLDNYRSISMYELDINNNRTLINYPTIQSPTYDGNFRHAIAHMVDKDFIITTYLGGYGAKLESPIMPWLRWYDPTMAVHPYNPATACQILFDNGWRANADPASGALVHFPASWPTLPGGSSVAGLNLVSVLINSPPGGTGPGIIFYRRQDDSRRSLAGDLVINGDETHQGLRAIGIPVDDHNVQRTVTSTTVMKQKNYHIYTGGWSLSRDPDYLFDLYHESMYDPDPTVAPTNYLHIIDPIWNTAVLNLKHAVDLDHAETYAHEALQRFGEVVFFIPIWTNAGFLAHKVAWHALNVDSFGVLNWWNIYATNNPSIGITGGQLRWGFKSDIEQLNVLYSQWVWDWQVLDKIYDSMIAMNPLNIAVDMPWMANSWTIGTWTDPDTGMTASKISFVLRTDMKWINPVTGTVAGTVTPADVVDSFQEVYDHVGWNFGSVADLDVNPDGSLHIVVSANTITFYETVLSTWAFHWLGGLPITPKYILEPIADPHGFVPGSGTFNINILVGSGAFYLASYTPLVSVLMEANRLYFKTIVPNTDTNPTTIKIDWGIFKSNVRSGDWVVNVLDLITVASSVGWTGRPGDIPQDINKDGKVNVLDLILVATNIGASW
jgi:peptide/nickel transport system substrate-binding protein